MDGLGFRPLFTLTLDVEGGPQTIGLVPEGHLRRVIPISGGRFAGERLTGTVRPGGAAWAAVRPDGVVNLEVRIVLESEAKDLIYLHYAGLRGGPPEIVEAFTRGEAIPDGADYFRVAMRFETAAPRLRWLNDILAVGKGRRPPSGPCYDVYEIL